MTCPEGQIIHRAPPHVNPRAALRSPASKATSPTCLESQVFPALLRPAAPLADRPEVTS